MNHRIATILALSAAMALGAAAQRTIPRQRLRPAVRPEVPTVMEQTPDTLVSGLESLVQFSGFEKPLRSRRENFFVTNIGADTIADAAITLTYTDMKGRMLHRRSLHTGLTVPPGETRRCDLRSWDTQQTFHYHLSPPSARAAQATPFAVTITADTLYIIK